MQVSEGSGDVFNRHLQEVIWAHSVAETSTWETKHHTQRVGEIQFIMPAHPEELTLQALSPEQPGYSVLYRDRHD